MLDNIQGSSILLLDVETTGLPEFTASESRFFHYTENDKYDSARIIQIAWVYIENFDVTKLKKYKDGQTIINSYYRKPKDFKKFETNEVNKISYDKVKEDGILLSNIINNHDLGKAISGCQYIVGHNVLFDIHILMNELFRINFTNKLDKLNNMISTNKYICTGNMGKDICKIQISGYYNYKMPRLGEMYYYYYGKIPDNLHDAQYDVLILVNILYAMIKIDQKKKK